MRRHRRAERGRPPAVSVANVRRSAARKRSPGNRGRLGEAAIHSVRSHSPIRSKSDHCAPVEALGIHPAYIISATSRRMGASWRWSPSRRCAERGADRSHELAGNASSRDRDPNRSGIVVIRLAGARCSLSQRLTPPHSAVASHPDGGDRHRHTNLFGGWVQRLSRSSHLAKSGHTPVATEKAVWPVPESKEVNCRTVVVGRDVADRCPQQIVGRACVRQGRWS